MSLSHNLHLLLIQVNILVDNLDVKNVNSVNLKAAASAALLLLPSKFTEVSLFIHFLSISTGT